MATHGISWQGLRDKYGNGNPINEVVTEFIARGVCRLMRQDNFTLLENGKKEDSCGYSLALQYIKELTTKYKDIFIKAYLKDNNGYLFDGIGYENAGELNKLVRDVINGTGYYNENIQTQFEDLFDKIEKYRQAKAENENDM